jgi:hypothetical protein
VTEPQARWAAAARATGTRVPSNASLIGDDAEALKTPLRGEPAKEVRIVAFGRVRVVPGRPTARSPASSGSASISLSTPLVRCQPSNEKNASARAPTDRVESGRDRPLHRRPSFEKPAQRARAQNTPTQ